MAQALLVDVDAECVALLPAQLILTQLSNRQVREIPAATKAMPADVVLIGPAAENPLLSAQQLLQTHPSAELIIITPAENLPALSRQVVTTPFIPLGVRLIEHNNPQQFIATVHDVLNRIERKEKLTHVMRASLSRLEHDTTSSKTFINFENQRQLFSAVVEASDDAILTLSLEGIITSWNRAAEALYGLAATEAVGKSIEIILQHEGIREMNALINGVCNKRKIRNYEMQQRSRHDDSLFVSLSLFPIEDHRGTVIGISFLAHDISEKKRTLAFVEEMQTLQATILEAALDAIITMDHLGNVIEFNPAAQSMFGISRATAVEHRLEELIIPPRLRQAHREGLQKFMATGIGPVLGKRLELSAMRATGEEFPVEVSILQLAGQEPPKFAGFLRDLTELKAAERESLQLMEDLKRSNEELEQFAYIASHDLKEPLRMVASFSELLAERYRDKLDEKADKYIFYIVDGATRMRRMIDDLLTYSRAGSRDKTFTPTDCNVAVKNALSVLAVTLRESNADIVCSPLPTVFGNLSLLSEVFQNLLHNAIKFRGERALVIHIDVRQHNNEWIFSVADNGIGFEMEHAKRIFQMFQRLHPRGKYEGTGVGLALVKKIIERHGGRLWVEALPDQGATFYFSLPVIQKDEEAPHDGTH